MLPALRKADVRLCYDRAPRAWTLLRVYEEGTGEDEDRAAAPWPAAHEDRARGRDVPGVPSDVRPVTGRQRIHLRCSTGRAGGGKKNDARGSPPSRGHRRDRHAHRHGRRRRLGLRSDRDGGTPSGDVCRGTRRRAAHQRRHVRPRWTDTAVRVRGASAIRRSARQDRRECAGAADPVARLLPLRGVRDGVLPARPRLGRATWIADARCVAHGRAGGGDGQLRGGPRVADRVGRGGRAHHARRAGRRGAGGARSPKTSGASSSR